MAGNREAGGFVNRAVRISLYSAIHKAGGRRLERPPGSFQLPAPFTAYRSFRNCTRQNRGTAANREVGGFVNSAVNPV